MKLNEAIEQIKKEGYKTTGKRKDILTFFAEADGYRTAKDLIAYLEPLYEGISFDTVYRNLHLFHEVGVLETTELNGEKNFRISCTEHHHHHFICKDCGKTKEIEVCPMKEVQQSLGNYAIEDHKFEIYGLCPACQ
ncbi:Fur family transcriptional regulator [Lentibacillus amyloliquefaciens]|uniref:Fur family transcriptional regulator n=1 Tax=Lentibacillus amyloliquefaciens TaxID=1472767 RepID=A0A0U3WBE8_9BACI|nr:Fur family transcriptional regulator [Lentibacillus amyloliquefaciens]ALX47151.1 Fur family transcriptional regulator [Lentibacillus amyloliquefaciens]